jgi:hypothetical protein
MSLHDAAQHLAAQGRGPDNTLVHMSKDEVAGLQAIAKMKGGSLTINPETGMAEAGFLDDIMPTLVGAAGMYFGIDPMTTAAIMGGGTAMQTGDLGKGLMAGLGAYGGANMVGGLGAEGALGAMTPDEVKAATLLNGGTQEAAAANAAEAFKTNVANGLGSFADSPSASALGGWKNIAMGAAPAIMGMMAPQGAQAPQGKDQMIRPYTVAMNPQATPGMVGNKPMIGASYQPGQDTSERMWFQPQFTAQTPYKAAAGGLMDLQSMAAGGGPVEQMSNQAAIGANTQYPMSNMNTSAFAVPYQDPRQSSLMRTSGGVPSGGVAVNSQTGELNPQGTRLASGGLSSLAAMATGEDVMPMDREKRMAMGGVSTLGGYASGGNPRLLKGPGDGMSDNIPAVIGNKQPARLADGEFVVPADVVSHLGNGSTDAGAKQLYKMMDRIRQQRTGKKKQAPQVNPGKAMPA